MKGRRKGLMAAPFMYITGARSYSAVRELQWQHGCFLILFSSSD